MIYGSTAIKFWFPSFTKKPVDLDILSESKTNGVDSHWHPRMKDVLSFNTHPTYLDPDLLYTFKLSHLSYPINWDKHMKDAIFLKNMGCSLNKPAYDILMDIWEDVHSPKYGSKSKIKLKSDNGQFFKKTVDRKFEHDWLHEQISFYDRPLHESIRKDVTNAFPSYDKWCLLSYDDKLKCALEECYVIASERFIFVESPLPPNLALVKATKLLITDMTKGWFNLFLKENFLTIIEYDKSHYIKKVELLRGIYGY
jgi:hypothetical protein